MEVLERLSQSTETLERAEKAAGKSEGVLSKLSHLVYLGIIAAQLIHALLSSQYVSRDELERAVERITHQMDTNTQRLESRIDRLVEAQRRP